VRTLNLNSQQHIAYEFDSYCKKVLKYYARDCYTDKKQQNEREATFSGLSERELAELAVMDEYFKDAFHFSVLDYDIGVTDEALAEALQALPADKRDIVLLSYFLDMPDREIAERMNLVRRTVAYRKAATLRELKKLMEGQAYE
jgi:RNA polymerase sigma factor (sigma-70 family)